MSGGELQRAAIARALINKPRILLADEPTGNLDGQNGTHIMKLIRDLNHDEGLTVVMVTHNLDLIAEADLFIKQYFRDLTPVDVGFSYALGAATLWALGTVLGRYLARDMRFEHVATLRFAFGLPASAIALLVLGAPAFSSRHDSWYIALLAVVTGFLALGLYYYGLRVTPAVAATLAELAFPVSAILVGYFKFGQVLTGWQWVGVAATSLVVALLPARPRDPVDVVPIPAPVPA